MLPKVGVIYLSYNGKSYLDDVLVALRGQDYPSDRLEIIVVDNASKDGSQAYLRTIEGITFFPNEKNLGFAEGNNMGIEHALLHGCDYVYLHNNDLKLDRQAISQAVAMAQSDHTIGSVQSLMKLWQHPDTINSTGGMIHFLGFGFVRDNGRKDADVQVTNGEEIAYASGAAVLYRSSLLKKIGFLDPYLFLYHEDLQLGLRIRLAGFKNVLCATSIAYHDYTFKKSIQKFYWMERNRWLVHLTCLQRRTLIAIVPFMLLLELPLLILAIKGGWLKEKLIVYAQFFRPATWKYLRETRKRIQSLRQVSDASMVPLFTSKIEHQDMDHPLVTHIGNPLFSALWYVLKRVIR